MMRKAGCNDKRPAARVSISPIVIPHRGLCWLVADVAGDKLEHCGGKAGVKRKRDEMSKDGLNVVITGSASGLGAATAKIMARDGARLVINYASSQKDAEAVAEECRKLGAADVAVVQGDVAKDEDCKRIVEAAAKWGRLDALVNNAGITKHVAHNWLDQLSAEDFQRIYAVNTIGPYQMLRAARPLLEAGAKAAGRSSAVVNVSSVAALSGIGSSIAYVASKGALNSMTLSLARALAPSIRINAICPGYIDTPWFTKGRGAEQAKQVRDMISAQVPLKLASSPEDIAGLVCFLASPQSGSMTGELVRIDAGMHLGDAKVVTARRAE
jgi:3-oxoacyl-[acyl-carrier protein] reductase